jgi:hypothetical protein
VGDSDRPSDSGPDKTKIISATYKISYLGKLSVSGNRCRCRAEAGLLEMADFHLNIESFFEGARRYGSMHCSADRRPAESPVHTINTQALGRQPRSAPWFALPSESCVQENRRLKLKDEGGSSIYDPSEPQ